MMRAPKFRYVAARTVKDAALALQDGGADAMLLAGGTDLVPNMKRRQQTPAIVIGIRNVSELKKISNGKGLTLGTGLTLTEITEHEKVRAGYAALAKAAGSVATPHLRNMGTLGGNLCLDTRCNYYDQNYEWRKAISFCMKAPGSTDGHACTSPDGTSICWVATSSPRCWAVSSTDTAPALIALGAEVTLVSTEGERRIPLEQLYNNDGMAYLTKRRDEIVTKVHLPPNVEGRKSTYWKLRRRGSFDFPVLSVAASARFSGGGSGERGAVPAGAVVLEARVVLGAVASRPLIVPEAATLVGKRLTDDVIATFAEQASRLAKPLDNTDFELGWRKKVAKSYVVGALKELRVGG
ncbi:MAG: FAD binding domain-containing protein [Gemmatimonadales bacterium]|nr:FAD binding domain-containing protein [Gemmatimonadales bacterium]